MSSGQDCGTDAGAYVLGAMDGAEASAFERHLATCVACREEVDTLQSAADALPLMVPQMQVPQELRRRVMTEVRADAAVQRAAAERAGETGRTARAERGPGGAHSLKRWLAAPRIGPALAGAGALAVAVIVAIAVSAGSPGTRLIPAQIAFTGARASLRIQNGRGELVVRGMPAPAAGKIYEVWIQRGHGAPQPTEALFDVTTSGDAAVAVPANLSGVTVVMVTAEHDGGSRTPHGPVLIAAKLD